MAVSGRSKLLNSGFEIPLVGLGVYKSPAAETTATVLSALKLGYRHIDTAQVYGNEAEVGQAVAKSGIPREEVFITSKVWRSEWGYERTLESIKASLARLGGGYIDLMLLHSPGDPATRADTWRAMEDAQAQGLVRSIGVSNFGQAHLDKLRSTWRVPPAVNQIEVTPFLQRKDLVKYCQDNGIVVEAYSPLAKGAKLSDPVVSAIATAKGVATAQILLRWSLQHGLVPLPKSSNPERQASNLDVFGFELSAEEMASLDALDEDLVTGWDPITADPV